MEAYKANRMIGVILLLLSIGAWISVYSQVQVMGDPDMLARCPTFFPRVGVVLLGVMSLVLIGDSFSAQAKASDEKLGEFRLNLEIVVIVVLFFVYLYVGFFRLGFFLNSVWFLFVLMLFLGYRNWLVVVLVSVLLPAVLWYFFTEVANVPLPRGPLLFF